MQRPSLFILSAALITSAALAQQPPKTTEPSTPSTSPSTNRSSTYDRSTTTTDRSSTADRSTSADRGTVDTNRSSDSANNSDQKFLKDFAQANAAEVETGKLASEKAENKDVKAFGKHMADDHSKTITKIQTLASKSNIDVKEEPDMMHKAKEKLLNRKDGSKFDDAYIKAQVNDHEKVVDMLQKEIKDGQDPSIKALASQALPDVRHHLDMAKQLQAQLGGKSSAKTSMTRDSKDSQKTAASKEE